MNIKQQPITQMAPSAQSLPMNQPPPPPQSIGLIQNPNATPMPPQHQYQHHQPQPTQNTLEMEQKNNQGILESLTIIASIRDDINVILENVAKSNSANNLNSNQAQTKLQPVSNPSSTTTTTTTTTSTNANADTNESGVPSVSVAVLTPASVSNNDPLSSDPHLSNRQQQLASQSSVNEATMPHGMGQGIADGSGLNGNDWSALSSNEIDLDREEQQSFLEKSNIKFLQEKIMEVNKNFQ